MADIISVEHIEKISKKLHDEDKKIVLTGGCFDIIHIGHISLLENAKKEGNILMVMVESDASIKAKKGINRPIHTQQQRAHILSAIASVDYVILLPQIMSNDDYDAVVRQVKPSLLATTKGDPYAFHKERQATQVGGQVVYVNQPFENISTSTILDILAKEV